MTAFAVGHLAYMGAFMTVPRGALSLTDIVVSGATLFIGLGIYLWLKPHLPIEMHIPVAIYFIIILMAFPKSDTAREFRVRLCPWLRRKVSARG